MNDKDVRRAAPGLAWVCLSQGEKISLCTNLEMIEDAFVLDVEKNLKAYCRK